MDITDLLEESDFSEVSSNGMNPTQVAEKILKLEAELLKLKKKESNVHFYNSLAVNVLACILLAMVVFSIGGQQNTDKEWNAEVKEQIAKKNKELKNLEERFEKLAEENNEFKKKLAKLKEGLEGVKMKNDDLKEKVFKLAEDNTGLNVEMAKMKGELAEKIKEANSNQFGGPSMMQIGIQIGEKFEGLKKEFGKLSEKHDGLEKNMAKVEKKMKEIEVKNVKLKGQIVEKNGEMGKMKEERDKEKAKLERLMDKMKEEFDQKNAEFEAKMRELLGKKADKKELVQFKNNKLNALDCGPKLDIFEGGLVVKHSGSDGLNCIRAISPIPTFDLDAKNPSIADYFEVQIVHKKWNYSIQIGFCTQQFPLEDEWIGNEANSIGIYCKGGMHIDGQSKKFGNAGGDFNVGDVIGVGIIYFPANPSMKCFATSNGKLLGTVELPDKFVNLQLFPAATLFLAGESIRANFGQQKWLFNPGQLLQ